MKQHIVDQVGAALRATELLGERIEKVLFALRQMPDDKARKSYIKTQLMLLNGDVNLVVLRVNAAKEKLIQHELV